MRRNVQTYPDCAFPLQPAVDVATLIRRNLQDRTAFSLIRIGDGEGMVLSRPDPSASIHKVNLINHFGPAISASEIALLADRLQKAIGSADLIGVRSDMVDVQFPDAAFDLPDRKFTRAFKAAFPLRPGERGLSIREATRLALTHRFLRTFPFPRDTAFCSAWISFELSANLFLMRALHDEELPALITGKRDLAARMSGLLGKEVDGYDVPEFYAQAIELDRNYQCDPGAYRAVLDTIQVRYPGQLFLVGAGIWGKIFCARIKQLGGIALDIGAVCDAWMGAYTRPLVLQSLFDAGADSGARAGVGTVPDTLLLDSQADRLRRHV